MYQSVPVTFVPLKFTPHRFVSGWMSCVAYSIGVKAGREPSRVID